MESRFDIWKADSWKFLHEYKSLITGKISAEKAEDMDLTETGNVCGKPLNRIENLIRCIERPLRKE